MELSKISKIAPILLVFILVFIVGLNILPVRAAADSVHNTDTDERFDKIQAAINDTDTDSGDTIEVTDDYDSSNESFPIEVDKSQLKIKAAQGNWPDVVATNKNASSVFEITAEDVTLQGMTVEAESGNGDNEVQRTVHVDGADGVTLDRLWIENNNVTGSDSYGILAEGSATNLTITSTWVKGVNSNSGEGYGIYLDQVNGEVVHSTVLNNGDYGIYVTGGDFSIHNTTISGNSDYGLYFEPAGSSSLDATNNYWGDRRGPRQSESDPGEGDAVSESVEYDPWLILRNSDMFFQGEEELEISETYEGNSYGLSALADFGGSDHSVAAFSVATYKENPADDPKVRGADYLDVYFVSEATPDSLDIEATCTSGDCYANVLRWDDGGTWYDTDATKEGGVLEKSLTDSTTPSVSDLGGTPFVVGSTAPLADFSYSPSDPGIKDTVEFDASESFDPDGEITSYNWDFGDGNTATGEEVSHTYAEDGSYEVELKVEDNNGKTDSTKTALKVKSVPTARFDYSPEEPNVGKQVSFDASDSSDFDGSIVSYEWDFGDETSAVGEEVSHVFEDQGTFNVKLTVTDDDGLSSSSSKEIAVNYEKEYVKVDEAGWTMVSSPIDPANKAPTSVFSGLDNQNAIYHWSSAVGKYLSPTSGYKEVEPFHGSWVLLDSSEVPKVFSIKGIYRGSVEIELEDPGWHQVGVPMDYGWSDLGVTKKGGETLTVERQAAGPSAPHWLSRFIYSWNRKEETYVAYDARDSSFKLEPGQAYWVRTYEEGVKLVVPHAAPPPVPSSLSGAPKGVTLSSEKARELDLPEPPYPPTPLSTGKFSIRALPNPLSGRGTITFITGGSDVNNFEVSVYNAEGRKIHNSGTIEGRTYEWNPVHPLSNGVYLYSVIAKIGSGRSISRTGKLLVLS